MSSQVNPDLQGNTNSKWITVKGKKVALNRAKSPEIFGKRVSLTPKEEKPMGRSPLAEACAAHEELAKKIKKSRKQAY
jgi:hypothetical protein